MKLERLKKNHKKEIIIGGLITLGIVSALTLVTTKAKYKLTESIPLVSGTINYKPYDFKIMAMYQQNNNGTYKEINEMPSKGYIVNEEKTYCTADNKTQVKGKIKTVDGNVVISNLSKSDKCYVWFDKETPRNAQEIIAMVNPKTSSTTFTEISDTDEGVYAVADGMYGGTSYYWRGAVTNNYVKFANFCWRIIRINGDGSIRLIYDGSTCHVNGTSTIESIAVTNQTYNSINNQSNYAGWTYSGALQRPTDNATGTSSNAKTQTDNWFNTNITVTNAEKVVEGKFCNDRNVQKGNTWAIKGTVFYYAAYERLYNKTPTLSCSSGDIYMTKAGAITTDEAIYAGGLNTSNTSYYLYNGQNYWTISPYFWYSSGQRVDVFVISSSGSIYNNRVDSTYGIRPVINLKSDITFSSGDGTLNSPYVVQ